MNSTVLRLGVITGAAALLMLGLGVAATAIARGDDPGATDTIATADDGAPVQDDASEQAPSGPAGPVAERGTAPDGDRDGHRAGPPAGDRLAVPPEEQRLREEGGDGDSSPDDGTGDDDADDDSSDTPRLVG